MRHTGPEDGAGDGNRTHVSSRVRRRPRGRPLPSEPYVRDYPHTAQAAIKSPPYQEGPAVTLKIKASRTSVPVQLGPYPAGVRHDAASGTSGA